jgi:hypothetical protein
MTRSDSKFENRLPDICWEFSMGNQPNTRPPFLHRAAQYKKHGHISTSLSGIEPVTSDLCSQKSSVYLK